MTGRCVSGWYNEFVEILHRAETGPMIEEKDFERKLVALTIKRLVKDYGIKFDSSEIVPNDDRKRRQYEIIRFNQRSLQEV